MFWCFVTFYKSSISMPHVLRNMRQLMRQQPLPLARPRCILSSAKHHITTHRIGSCIDCSRRFRRLPISMYPHLAEILTEVWLHRGTCRCVQGLTTSVGEHRTDDGRYILCFPSITAVTILFPH